MSNVKHAHLRKDAFLYFQTHTFDQTRKKFGLTRSQLRACFNSAYRDPALNHIRKDKRRKDPWSLEEKIALLQFSGLQHRDWIAKKLKRGNETSVKEMMIRLNSETRYINGMSVRMVRDLLQMEDIEYIESKGYIKYLVPWVNIYYYAKKSSTLPPDLLSLIFVMARFQKRVHGTSTRLETVERIKNIARKK